MSEEILKNIMLKGFDHLSALTKALQKMQEEATDEEDAIKKSATLSMVFRALNDVLHPGYVSAPQLLPEQDLEAFIIWLNEQHQDAIEKKIFPDCKCKSCDEPTARNTDQAQ